ncbi:MAG: type I restriction-modification system subunit M [Bacteroidales bacterium]|nr:type I restriction-modification system subunit M [Bacteroidales bacterium]
MSEELQQKLRTQLWTVANTLRGNMSASDFMYFTLGFIFYKYLSEKIEMYINSELEADEMTFKEAWASDQLTEQREQEASSVDSCRVVTEEAYGQQELKDEIKEISMENLGYFIEPEFLYSSVIEAIKRKENILPMLERSLKKIEDSTIGHDSEEDFGGLFSDIDLASPKLGKTADDKNTLVSNVLLALDDIDFGLTEASDIDILGDAYEYMIGQFAAGAGKKAGEFYTPQEVSQILADIVTTGKTRLKNVYDPTCGSGSLLLRTARNGKADLIYGQEKNPTTFNLARMNMLLHGVKFSDFSIENGDTLEADAFPEEQFDAVVANPPFSAEWSAADKFNNDDRFSKAGRLAPRKTADYAFILHMIYHLNEGGTMACVAPHGVLFRGNTEGVIRRFLIEKKNYIDAIIGLPANIFYGTSIPTCILVMKKCRKENDNILFIDASKEFEKVKTQNKLRPQHIQKIVDTYRERKEIEKYSHLATLQEVADNDYNLNIPRYVDTFEEEEPIDIKAVMAEIKELEAKRAELDKEIEVYLKELGIME